MIYRWSKDMETGHPLIDEQHKELIRIINELLSTCQTCKGEDNIEKIMAFLDEYVEKHFSDEEKIQRQYKYPDYINHHNMHEAFKAECKMIKGMLHKEGPSVAVVSQVNTKLSWLVNHIKQQDKKLVNYINSTT